MRPVLCLLFTLLHTTASLKFLVYNPLWGRSHVNFMSRVAEVLSESGHNVTMVMPALESTFVIEPIANVKIIKIPQCDAARQFEKDKSEDVITTVWSSKSVLSMLREMTRVKETWVYQCNDTVSYPGLMPTLEEEKFDAGLAEPMDMCGLGMFHQLGIDKVALMLSIASFEGAFEITGLPSFPSYVPGAMTSHGEVMSFTERIFNTLSLAITKIIFPNMALPYEQMFRSQYGEDFPGIFDLLSRPSFFFLNDEPLIEFPRPTIHRIIDIGGLSVHKGHKPLNETWSSIMNLRKKTVLFSLGTMAKSYLMPKEYKKTIRNTFKRFPDVTFIWKYEKPEDRISEGIDNIIESTWIPQNDMLYDSRLSFFITHCGQGSTTEATTAGLPLIVIPVLGDQMRNAQVIKRIGTGVVLKKEDLGDDKVFEEAIRQLLNNNEYAQRAHRIGEMIRNRPFTAKDTFIRNVEFMAKYGPLKQLDHYGRQLNFFQYYLIDVFAFIAFVVISLVSVVALSCRFVVRKVFCSRGKAKQA